MFRIGLRELDRAGTIRLERDIAADDPLWDGAGLGLVSAVHCDLTAHRASSGEIVVRGTVRTRVGGECRRCLEPVERAFERELDLVWSVAQGDEEQTDEGGEIRSLDPGVHEVDVGAAVREELLLTAPLYLVCRSDCKGICPRCGVNRNEEECECVEQDRDPRWEALRALETE